MGEPTTETTPLMRLLLGASVTAFMCGIGGPVILVIASLFALGLFAGAAVALEHSEVLQDVTVFRVAHWAALVSLGALLATAIADRYWRPRATGWRALFHRPVLLLAISLPLLTLLLLRVTWNTGHARTLAGVLVLADFYFFVLASLGGLCLLAFRMARSIYAWAVVGRFRAGFVSGALVVVLLLLAAVGSRQTPSTVAASDTHEDWSDRVGSARQADAIDTELSLLRSLDDVLEPTAHARMVGHELDDVVVPPTTSTQAASDARGDDTVDDCLRQLATTEVPKVERSIRSKFRYSDDDVHDIVIEALFNVCQADATKQYKNRGAVLQTAATNRALDWRRRRYSRCVFVGDPPACSTSGTELEVSEQVDRILDVVRCGADARAQAVIDKHVREGMSFDEIDLELGLKPGQARDAWYNFIKKARARLEKDCGN